MTVPSLARVEPPAAPLPLLRLLRTAVRNPIEMWPEAVYREPVLRLAFGGRRMLFVCDPDLIREVLVDDAESYEKADAMRRSLEPALGRGLLTAEGQHWRWQRRASSPLFRHEALVGFLPRMIEAATRRRDLWLARPGVEVDVAREMMLTTFEIILDTMLSGKAIDGDRAERAISDYLEPLGWVIAQSLLRLPSWTPFPGRLRMVRARSFLRGEILRIVAERRRHGPPRDDLIALLLAARDPETGRSMSDQEIADNLLTFVTAGHETTALALTWTFYLLDRHREAAAGIREEVGRVAGEGPLRAEHVEHLSYTRQVLQEAMRLYPPAAVITRAAQRDTRLGGEPVTAGTQVYVPAYALHRQAALWPDPDRFDPKRFRPEAVRQRHRYAYLPFGAGPRICIGMSFAMMEATAILAVLLRQLRLDLRPGFEPTLVLRVTLRPGAGMPMTPATL